jgi:hypothetical protein
MLLLIKGFLAKLPLFQVTDSIKNDDIFSIKNTRYRPARISQQYPVSHGYSLSENHEQGCELSSGSLHPMVK